MVNTNNQEGREYITADNVDIKNNYWMNRLLTWWSGFSLRTKLLAIATLVAVSYTHLTLPTKRIV